MKKINLADFIRKTGEQVSLSGAEREHMFSVMKEYIAMKPVLAPSLSADASSRALGWGHFGMRFAAAGLVVTVLVSGAGVSYAAEKALPGDILYTVKVSFNEQVAGLTAVSSEAKAKWEMTRAETRLEEASALAAQGRLTPAAETDLAARFERHADSAAQKMDALSVDNSPAAIDVASSFETEVAAHLTILDEIAVDTGRDIKDRVLKKARVISRIRTSAENGIAISVSASAPATALMMPAQDVSAKARTVSMSSDPEAQKNTDSQRSAAKRLAASAKAALKENVRLVATSRGVVDAAAEAAITEAKQGIAEGDSAIGRADFGGAFHAYQGAFVSLKRLNVILKTASRNDVTLSIDGTHPSTSIAENAASDVSSVLKTAETNPEAAEIKVKQSENTTMPSIQILPSDGETELEIKHSSVGDETIEQSVHLDVRR